MRQPARQPSRALREGRWREERSMRCQVTAENSNVLWHLLNGFMHRGRPLDAMLQVRSSAVRCQRAVSCELCAVSGL